MDLFAKEGSRGTPLAAIAERIGVTPPAISHHFGSKQALVAEVVEEADALIQSRMQLAAEASGLERILANRRWAELLLEDDGLATLQRLITVMVAEALDPDFPAHEHFVARRREFGRLLVRVITAGQRDGSIDGGRDPKLLAIQIMAFMQGAYIQWFLDPAGVPLKRVFEDYFGQLERDLTPGQA
jgi:AcrR family transcriptional regulator